MNNNEISVDKDNQKDSTNIAVEVRLMDKIAKAEQRIENGESYIEMSELKKKLGIQNRNIIHF